MHPFEELENYTVNARTRVPDHGGLPDRLIAASFSLKPYKKLKEKLAELDQQIEDKEARINAIRSFGILSGDVKAQRPVKRLPAKLKNWEDEDSFPLGHKKTDTALILGVDRGTIYNWIDSGQIKKSEETGRIPISEIKRIKNG